MKTQLLAFITATLIAGCASEGRKINQAAVPLLKVGTSTRAEVHAMLGDPNNIAQHSDGSETWLYQYKHKNLKGESFVPILWTFEGGVRVQTQEVTVTFIDGKVSEYHSNFGGTELRSGLAAGTRVKMPNAEGDRPIDGNVPSGLIDGLTMKERLERAGIATGDEPKPRVRF